MASSNFSQSKGKTRSTFTGWEAYATMLALRGWRLRALLGNPSTAVWEGYPKMFALRGGRVDSEAGCPDHSFAPAGIAANRLHSRIDPKNFPITRAR